MANPQYGSEDRDWRTGYGRGRGYGDDGDYERERSFGRGRMRDRDDDYEREQRSFSPRSGRWSGGDPYGDYGQDYQSDYSGSAGERGRYGSYGRDYRSSSDLTGGQTGPIYENQYGFSQGAQTGRFGEGRSGYGGYGDAFRYSRSGQQDQGRTARRGGQGGGLGPDNPYLANIAEGREQQAGQHRGRGPKNYVRSDERIREDVSDRLSDDPFLDASEIEIQVKNGEVTLTGAVDDRQAKRRAEDCADDVSGVKHVQNNLRVTQQASSAIGATAAGQARARNA